MRVLHFSDVHVGIEFGDVPFSKWFSKRALGGANLLLGRSRYFLRSRAKLEELAAFREEIGADLVLCTGDFTSLGLEREYRRAREAVDPLTRADLGFVAVPGNHDVYVRDVIREDRFDRHFGAFLTTDLPDLVVDRHWPLVRLVGDDVAVVAVDSARPNPPWSSSGAIPATQLDGLSRTLSDPRVRDRFVFVMTHYAPCLADGGPDRRLHGLTNVDEYLAACQGVAQGAILCGHVHRRYRVRPRAAPVEIFCGGSATMDGREGAWVFDIEPGGAIATPVLYDGSGYHLDAEGAAAVGAGHVR